MNSYDDKTMMTDMLSTQKFIAQNYNSYAGECASKQAKAKLMKILGEEHDIQFQIYEQMSAKGWYPTMPAPQDKINEAVQQHVQGATNLTKTADKARAKKVTTAKKTLSTAKTAKATGNLKQAKK
ncbi:MAG: spore coat protein [Oscillospiraceae bacterium]